jgi:uncharacterized membrane protein YfcA
MVRHDIVPRLHAAEILHFALLTLAAAAAGLVNALAGGGTLITFPALLAAGLPPVAANVTSTLALAPGYCGATLAQRRDLQGQGRRLRVLLPPAAIGGAAGALLVLRSGDRVFGALVPWLILFAALLIAVQNPLRAWLFARRRPAAPDAASTAAPTPAVLPLALALAAVYGGYFGAGLSVIVLAVLGLALQEAFTRLNAAKQAIALGVNLAAAACFAFSGQADWLAAAVMAVGALAGGALGGRLAGRVAPAALRAVVVTIGITVALIYLWR